MNLIASLLIGVVAFILMLFLSSGLRVVQQYERGVIFRLGRLQGGQRPQAVLDLAHHHEDTADRPADRHPGGGALGSHHPR